MLAGPAGRGGGELARLRGLERWERDLRKIAPDLAKDLASRQRKAIAPIVDDARRAVFTAPRSQGGGETTRGRPTTIGRRAVARSIRVAPVGSSRAGGAILFGGKLGRRTRGAGPTSGVAFGLAFGGRARKWPRRGAFAPGGGGGTRAYFLWPQLDRGRAKLLRDFENRVGDTLDEFARKRYHPA